MAGRMTGTMTIACETDAQYVVVLADVQAAGVYTNIVTNATARTIQFDVDDSFVTSAG